MAPAGAPIATGGTRVGDWAGANGAIGPAPGRAAPWAVLAMVVVTVAGILLDMVVGKSSVQRERRGLERDVVWYGSSAGKPET
ncbi:hypothetical protein [Lysobacter sp. A3-1-A15]|uniref:hypothetical protein n=1 Tax=Novilysobacter viscosus TaxID=3098602 RepID=UPI002EDAC0C2